MPPIVIAETGPTPTGDMPPQIRARAAQEWPTLALLVICPLVWAGALFGLALVSAALAWPVIVLALVLHSSLSHEILHGHPFASQRLNTALGILQPGLFVPFLRFRDTHLAHHHDARLTDPYDDPESNYLDPAVWAALPGWGRAVLRINNTLLGRMVIGPIVAQAVFMRADWRQIRAGDRAVLAGWLWHLPGVVGIMWAVSLSPVPVLGYVAAAYAALSILKIRTFLEHRAHAACQGRTVIIEDRGLLAFLFLNNNLHAVHHLHPGVAWYDLPGRYTAQRAQFQAGNDGYVYPSYRAVIARYFWRAKDPVAHPLWSRD